MSNHDAVEAALNQYSLLLTGKHIGDFNEADQDGMREELHALLDLMLPYIQKSDGAKALHQLADKIDSELAESDQIFHAGMLSSMLNARLFAQTWERTYE